MATVKSEILDMKAKLEKIEANLAKQAKQIQEREDKWKKMEHNIKLLKANTSQKVFLNIGGVKFTTTVSTLISDSTSIFNSILSSKEVNLNEELYIERRGDLFEILLNYLRTGEFNYKLYKKQFLLELKEEADFFNIQKIYEEIDDLTKDIEITNFEYSGDYVFKGQLAGTQKLEDIKTKDLNTGICANTPGMITFELKNQSEFQELEVAGYNGNTKLWYPGNGSGAKIYVSSDKKEWEQVGTLSSSYASKIVLIKLKKKCLAKYIKFENTSYIGLGYFFVKRIELV